MMEKVANAMGAEFLREVVFVGGCVTELLLDDALTLERVRLTEDVDLIVQVIGRGAWYQLQQRLKEHGFSEKIGNEPICTMWLDDLRVDFMPVDLSILGFSNKWYLDGFNTAQDFMLTKKITIRLIHPVYFIATKFEAYLGRGKNDPLSSSDIEDILTLLDGRELLQDELGKAQQEVKNYIAYEFKQLVGNTGFEFALSSAANGDREREILLFKRIEKIVNLYN